MSAPQEGRFARQVRLPQVGAEGQERLAAARVAVIGLGATGSHLASQLARAGVGTLHLVDRDVVEVSNLPRQTLYTQADAEALVPKAQAAAAALARVDPALDLHPRVCDLTAANAEALLGDVDLLLDGTDNVPTRLLLNDLAVRSQRPFVYCGAVGTEGQLLVVRPGGPCLRCYLPEAPPAGSLPTCDTAGVFGPAVALVAALAAGAALRLLLHPEEPEPTEVVQVDGWRGRVRRSLLPVDPACPCCQGRRFPFLDQATPATPTRLCGQEAIQLPARGGQVDLDAVARRLEGLARCHPGAWVLRLDLDGRRVLLFKDGRMVIGGTREVSEARAIAARLFGT